MFCFRHFAQKTGEGIMGENMNPLDALRDIHTPTAIGWWPIAPGWWILMVLLVLCGIAITYWLKRRPNSKPKSDLRNAAMEELSQIEQELLNNQNDQKFIRDLSLLLKRLVHSHHPQASSLSGENWLAFLDQTGGDGQFKEFYHQLCIAPYAGTKVEHKEKLIALVRAWISHFPQYLGNKERR